MKVGAAKTGPHRKPLDKDVANYRVSMEADRIVLDPVASQGFSLGEFLLAAGDPDSSSTGGVTVSAKIVAEAAGQKIIVFKKHRRHNHRRKKGHRQQHTILRISGLDESGGKKRAPAEAVAPEGPPQKLHGATEQSEEVELSAVAAELEKAAGRMDASLERAIEAVRIALDTDREAAIRKRFEAEMAIESFGMDAFAV